MARGAARRRELAVRMAIGAGRGRLLRQLLTESLVLAVAGGALGILVGMWTLEPAGRAGAGKPAAAGRGDARLAGGVRHARRSPSSVGAIFGLMPAVQASKPALNSDLQGWRTIEHLAHGRPSSDGRHRGRAGARPAHRRGSDAHELCATARGRPRVQNHAARVGRVAAATGALRRSRSTAVLSRRARAGARPVP